MTIENYCHYYCCRTLAKLNRNLKFEICYCIMKYYSYGYEKVVSLILSNYIVKQ